MDESPADRAAKRRSLGADARPETAALVDRLVAQAQDHALFVLDGEGRIASWNDGAARIYGHQRDDVLGHSVQVLYPEEARAAGDPDRDLAIAVADGHHDDEGWRARQDGTLLWADTVTTALRGDDGRLVGFGVISRDLSERRRGELALRESEERFRLLVSSVADYAIFLLDTEGRVASWNVGAERLKGYRPDEIIGRDLATFYTEDDRRAGVPDGALAAARADGRWAAEGWRVRKDGSRFWASVVITRLVGGDGEPRGFAKVTRDLTERKRTEDALRGILAREREAADQLREVDQLRSDLVSSVAHDLRAPVGVILSYLDLLRTDWATTPDVTKLEALDRIAERMGTLGALVDDVFDVVRIDAGHLETAVESFDLVAVVEAGVADGRTVAPSVEVALDAEPGVVALGDARRTWQVVQNLVSNAVKFTASGSAVTVRVSERGGEAVVSVTDAGPGIAPDDQGAIFERFTRLAGASGVPGSGLGLFIARSVAEAQGGRLEVQSSPGEGATFVLVLPTAEPVA